MCAKNSAAVDDSGTQRHFVKKVCRIGLSLPELSRAGTCASMPLHVLLPSPDGAAESSAPEAGGRVSVHF